MSKMGCGEPAPRPESHATLRAIRDQAERQAVVEGLMRNHGNISQAARELQVSRLTVHALLDKHHINAKEFK
jgi:transcriptional regulator with GAF, ATPase, and Fis domain